MSLTVDANAAVEYIQARARFGIKPGLERIAFLLQGLGAPHEQLRFVHVAGTNGKGSTCFFIAQMLQAAGYRVGLYTSPYLIAFAERMSVNGVPITSHELVSFTERVRRVAETVADNQFLEPTEFEIITALSFLFFVERKVDLVVLETGLGGRYDATNIVIPEVSVITNVDLDHTEILGKSVKEISFDKSGIIKEKIPVVTGAENAALAVVTNVAKEKQSPMFVAKRDLSIVSEQIKGMYGQRFSYFGMHRDFLGLDMRMLGMHQLTNAGIALGVIEVLQDIGYDIDEVAIRSGLSTAVWSGRFEVIHENPLVVLDGAHNPAGARALARALSDLLIDRYVLIIGVLGDKDIAGITQAVVPNSVYVIVTEPDVARAASANLVAEFVSKCTVGDTPIEVNEHIVQAVARGVLLAQQLSLSLCIMGSLYTVAQAKTAFMQK